MPTHVPSDSTFFADLTHNALIAVTGDDAGAFLHGQFTNDALALDTGAAQWSGWCTAKGRLLATFLLVREPGRFLMLLPAEIAEAVRKRLGMFVLRSKVKLEDVTSAVACLGIAGSGAAAIVTRHFGAAPGVLRSVERGTARVVRLDESRFVVFVPAGEAPALRTALSGEAAEAGPEAWDGASIRAGSPSIVAATQEAFVPQMVNFEVLGGVSFKKGCYPGQEIVARMHYRGGLKRRMALAHVAGSAAPRPGDSLYSAAFGEQAAGQVANVAPAPGGGFDMLVVAQLESLAARDLRWNSPAGPALRIDELPYRLPSPG